LFRSLLFLKINHQSVQSALEVARLAQGSRDAHIAKAEGDNKAVKLDADANAYKVKAEAQAEAEAIKVIAEANLIKELKRAQGVQANLDAEAKGNENLIGAFGGDNETFIKDSLIKNDQLIGVTEASAKAIKDAFGPITVWDTGSGGTVDLMKNIVAGATQLKNQTGIDVLAMFPNFTQKPAKKN